MLTAAAFVPVPPLLVPEIAGGSASADEAMRSACGQVVRRLCAADLDEIVLIGVGDRTGAVSGAWDWRGFGVQHPERPTASRLPHALAIGAWLLDTYAGERPAARFQAVTADLPAVACAELGHDLAQGDTRIGLLVCGDGTACRSEKAPGFYDPAAEEWDAAAVTALRAADPAGLLALEADLARRLLATGRAPWQVLAGAAGDGTFEAAVDWADAPYGVMYVAGTWLRRR